MPDDRYIPEPRDAVFCSYCTLLIPAKQPGAMEQIRAHIRECPDHPLRAAEQTIANLRAAIGGLVAIIREDWSEKDTLKEIALYSGCSSEQILAIEALDKES